MRPAGPEPTTATFLPVSGSWRTFFFQAPDSKVAAARFSLQMETGWLISPCLQSVSQAWVHTRPSASGKGTRSWMMLAALS